jgi:hypothetical protein
MSIGPFLVRHGSEAVNAYNPNWRDAMQYLLALYVDESGWGKMPPEQQKQGSTSYMA